MKATAILITLALIAANGFAQTTVDGRLQLFPNLRHQKTAGASTLTEDIGRIVDTSYTTGTNANQMTAFVFYDGALTNSQERTHDLTGIVNSYGDTVTFSRVNFLSIAAGADNTDAVLVGGSGSNAFAAWVGSTNATVNVMPGGAIMTHAPSATGLTVSTNGNLRIANTGTNAATYQLYIGGTQ